jgi:tetratricopeptide (TPR) repeat protein
MNTENTLEPKASPAEATPSQEAPAKQPETLQQDGTSPEPDFSATVAGEEAFGKEPGEQPETPQPGTALDEQDLPAGATGEEASGEEYDEQLETLEPEAAPDKPDRLAGATGEEASGEEADEQPETLDLEAAMAELDLLAKEIGKEASGEKPDEQSETLQWEIVPPRTNLSAAEDDEEAFDEDDATTKIESFAPPKPIPSQKKIHPLIPAALIIVIIVGIAIAITNTSKNESPSAEALEPTEIMPIGVKTEPGTLSPEPQETVASLAPGKTEKPETSTETKTEAEPELGLDTGPEKPQPPLVEITADEFERIDALQKDALTSHGRAKFAYQLGDYENALEYYKKARDIFEELLPYSRQTLGGKNPNTIIIQKNLAAEYNAIGEIYRIQKEYTEAMSWLNKSMDIRKDMLAKYPSKTSKSYQNNNIALAETYNNIALVHDGQGQYTKALDWLQRGLAINEKILGSDHPDTAKTYNNIGMVYSHKGDSANALRWFQKAAAIQERNQPDVNPNAAIAYHNIAEIYRAQHNYALALPEYLKAYRILVNTFGEGHSTTKSVKQNMAHAYEKSQNSQPFDEWLEGTL